MSRRVLTGARVFDGAALHEGKAVVIEGMRVSQVCAEDALAPDLPRQDLAGGILAPGLVDLQVNGGGGRLFNDAPDAETLAMMAGAHAGLGATTILPTLITDAPEKTEAAIDAVAGARIPGIAGLHLEGPHLARRKAGAHPPAHIRPMEDADLDRLCAAAERLDALVVTLAPEAANPEQIAALTEAGAVVSLGHSACTFEAALAARVAGARMVTHLFNAMSGLESRAPGLVGAALSDPGLAPGIIADGIHIHRESLALALRLTHERAFLVSDAMAPAGSDIEGFALFDRWVLRRKGRLTLEDGTLAGADLDLPRAMRVALAAGVGLETALAMATARPATLIGRQDIGHIAPGGPADLVHLSDELQLQAVWQGGDPVAVSDHLAP